MIYRLALLLVLASAQVSGSIVEEIVGLEALQSQVMTLPNPTRLNPQWWLYFNSDGDDLVSKVNAFNDSLQKLYLALPIEEQSHVHAQISKIMTTLNAYVNVKGQDLSKEANFTFLNTYTLEQTLKLNQESRKIKEEILNEIERLNQSKTRLERSQKYVDNLMVQYLGKGNSSQDKLNLGLEVILNTLNIKLAEENLKKDNYRLKGLQERENHLKEALELSKEHLEVKDLNTEQIEKHIALLERELEKSQRELSNVESNLLGHFNELFNDHHQQLVYEQKLLKAQVNQAYIWAQLAFQRLKYNVIMHFNQRLDHHEVRLQLTQWNEKVNEIQSLSKNWKTVSLKEQDRIRQEYAALIAQNDRSDQIKANLTERQSVLNILTTLELLQEEIANTQWLIHILDSYFATHSGFVVNWWIAISTFFTKEWTQFIDIMNFSLFKVAGVPITLWSLFKFCLICGLAFWSSILARKAIKKLRRRKEELSESTLHILLGLTQYSIMFVGLIVALCSIGFDFNNLLIVLGLILFGVSFGLQSVANNFFSGLRILFERKLNIGDVVILDSGCQGRVREIHIQNTLVVTNDGQKVIVPNSEIIGNTLVSWTKQKDYRRLHIPFSVSSVNDKELVRKVVTEAALRVPCTLATGECSEPQLWLKYFDNDVLKFELVVWIDYNRESITDSREADFLWEIDTALRKAKIVFSSPVHELLSPIANHL